MTERRTDVTSAFNTRTVGEDVSSFLIQQGGEERLMEIQQHDGVLVEVAGSRQGFAKRKRRGRGVTGGREAPGLGVLLPCASPLYIGGGEGLRPHLGFPP